MQTLFLFYYVFKNAQNNEKAHCYVQPTIQDLQMNKVNQK